MIRECATDSFDLPHEYVDSGTVCSCGRPRLDLLHAVAIMAEMASTTSRFKTEKGS